MYILHFLMYIFFNVYFFLPFYKFYVPFFQILTIFILSDFYARLSFILAPLSLFSFKLSYGVQP